MELIKWEPMSEFERFFDNRFFPAISFPSISSKFGWDLAVDLYEEKGNVVAKMTLPGIDPEGLDISVEGDFLRISGRREEETETKEKDYYSKEIRRGSFSRTVGLPRSVDASKVAAEYTDGVLKVMMPIMKRKEEKAVKVKVAKK